MTQHGEIGMPVVTGPPTPPLRCSKGGHMSQSTKRQTATITRHRANGRTARQPAPPRPRASAGTQAPRRSCFDCVFCISNALLWLRTLVTGFPVGGQCANHVDTPGQVRPIPAAPCRNFRGKPFRVEPPEPPNDGVRYIPLTRGLHAIVDAKDYEWLSRYKWHANPSNRNGTVYAKRTVGHSAVLMHRMIMRPPKGMVVDHINGNGLDNRRCNLRIVPAAVNAQNRRKRVGGKSRFIGVYPRGKKWGAFVGHRHVGVFDDEVTAAKARDRRALAMYGEHAWLNFPSDAQ
jgi:hypothetical protein